ncbi:hypothetical protein F5Y13DRAFT_201069 [Hypoxylon sp. FL1857]|nr:hypothetical protein F5Y13DRAFT_201069 [Hypoxylon sp. FL1857]
MDHSRAQYAGMEPSDSFAHPPDAFDTINFDDTPEVTADIFPSPDPPPPVHVAHPTESSERYGPPIQDFASVPNAAEPAHNAQTQYIDPRGLSNENGIANTVSQQNSQDVKHHVNNGNVYLPMGNFPGPASYPLNDIQYHPLQQTDGAYLGNVAAQGATYIQGAPYPVQGPSYPGQGVSHQVQGASHPVQGVSYPVQGPVYTVQGPMYPAPGPVHPAHGSSFPVHRPSYSGQAPYYMQGAPVPAATYPLHQAPLPMPQAPANIEKLRRPTFYSSNPKLIGLSARRSKLPTPTLVYHEPLLKRPEKGPNGEVLRNDKLPRITRKNQKKPNPEDWYGPPLPPTDSWGPKDKSGRPLFRYTEFGELERGKTYSSKEMRWYLYGPKKHEEFFEFPERPPGIPEVKKKVRQALTIWIGWVPPQSNDRYPYGAQSQRCRFADCPDPNHTIRSGFPRVIFDERMNMEGEAVDVFHNAGYAHLFCFEKHFDLIQAFIHLDVRPDDRSFKREDNLSKLSRHYPEMQAELEYWWASEYPLYKVQGRNRDRSYAHTLSCRLVHHALEHSSEGRIKMRESRGGADMSKHGGDLILQRFLKDCMQFNLVDDYGHPLPNAAAELEELRTNKRKRRAAAKKYGTIKIPVPVGSAYMGNTLSDYGFNEETPQLSPAVPVPIPLQQLVQHGADFFPGNAPTNYTQSVTTASLYQGQTPQSLQDPSRKRKMDEVSTEDRTIDLSHHGDQESIRELPVTRMRELSITPPISETVMVGHVPTADHASQQPQGNGEQPRNGEYLDIPSDIPMDLDLHQGTEAEIDDDAVFELIDKEMPGGKSPASNVDRTTEPPVRPEEGEPSKERQPSPAGSLERIYLSSGDDLFGDVALETQMLEEEVKQEPDD